MGPCYPASDHQNCLVTITNGSRYAGLPPAGEAARGWVLPGSRRPLLGWSSGATQRRWPCYAASSRQGCLVIITNGSRYPGLRPGLTRRPERMPLGASLIISMGAMVKGGILGQPWVVSGIPGVGISAPVHSRISNRCPIGASNPFAFAAMAHCNALKAAGKSLFEWALISAESSASRIAAIIMGVHA
jgi:hypothetical protein